MDDRTISRPNDRPWAWLTYALGVLALAGALLGVALQEGAQRDLKPANVAPVTSEPPWPAWADEDAMSDPPGVR